MEHTHTHTQREREKERERERERNPTASHLFPPLLSRLNYRISSTRCSVSHTIRYDTIR